MAIIFDGPVAPADATELVRAVPQPAQLTLNRILPDRLQSSMEVDFNLVTKVGNTARFRPHDAPAHISKRDSVQINRAPLLPLTSAKPVIGELEAAKLYGLRNGQSPISPVADAIYDDLTNSAQDVLRRAEQARASVLSTGTLPINEGGLNGTIDFGVPAGNKMTAPTLWSNTANADIITWLNSVRTSYINVNGFAPGRMILSTPVLNYMQQNSKLQSMAVQTIGSSFQGFAGLVPKNALDAILGTFSMPGVTDGNGGMVYDTRVSTDGSTAGSLVFPNNVVVLLPPDGVDFGYTAWGPTVTAQKLADAEVIDDARGLVGFVDRGDEFPYKEQSFVDSLMLPVITNPYSIFILTVA